MSIASLYWLSFLFLDTYMRISKAKYAKWGAENHVSVNACCPVGICCYCTGTQHAHRKCLHVYVCLGSEKSLCSWPFCQNQIRVHKSWNQMKACVFEYMLVGCKEFDDEYLCHGHVVTRKSTRKRTRIPDIVPISRRHRNLAGRVLSSLDARPSCTSILTKTLKNPRFNTKRAI